VTASTVPGLDVRLSPIKNRKLSVLHGSKTATTSTTGVLPKCCIICNKDKVKYYRDQGEKKTVQDEVRDYTTLEAGKKIPRYLYV